MQIYFRQWTVYLIPILGMGENDACYVMACVKQSKSCPLSQHPADTSALCMLHIRVSRLHYTAPRVAQSTHCDAVHDTTVKWTRIRRSKTINWA